MRMMFLVAALFFAACNGGVQIRSNERFTVAYRLSNAEPRVRFSSNGINWTTADTFPSVSTGAVPNAAMWGPGAAADAAGAMHLVAVQNQGFARVLVWGLGTNTYSEFPEIETGVTPMRSAPSLAAAGGNKWLFAFRTNGGNVQVDAYDATAKTFANVTPVSGVPNTSVTGRPCIAVDGNRVVLTFFREPPGGAELRIVTGTVDAQGVPTWDPSFPFPNSENGFRAVLRQHDLTHDNNQFVLGALRQDNPQPGDQLQRHSLFVYDSPDGLMWTRRTRAGMGTSLNRSAKVGPMSLAAHSNGVVLAAFLVNPAPDVFRFDGTNWSILADFFTGNEDRVQDFALISTGVP